MRQGLWLVFLLGGLLAGGPAAAGDTPGPLVLVRNHLDLARGSESIQLQASALKPWFKADELPRLRVTETAGGRELLAQAVDSDGDGAFDQLVFQAALGPREQKSFLLTLGERQVPGKEDFRAYGRFVRERFDDFAWENDRVAFRMYGRALETWEKEPLTSSAVDVWCKRTRRLVVNDWYLVDDYHRDTGEGADLYSAGSSRGCGGSGIWSGGRLFGSRNFRDSRVLANGPIRLVFELVYEPWDAGGRKVSEVKRVTLDAGENLNRFESRYLMEGGPELDWAAGIKKQPRSNVRFEREQGWLRTWEPLKEGAGSLGCGIVVAPAQVPETAEADGNVLVVARAPAVYHAGFGWDRSGDFAGVADWDRYLETFARRLRSPLEVEVKAR